MIRIRNTETGWHAMFIGGDMPQNVWLPLPFTSSATASQVKADLARRFPDLEV